MAEVAVVGGGHNGLICAAYLARAGIDTLLIEARDSVGGCASTVSDLGARFNICNCDHTLIRAMPVIDELDLEGHGLAYVESDASTIAAYHDDAPPWPFFHEPERTIDAIAATYPGQVDGYRRYLADAMPIAELVIEMARTTPTAARLLATGARQRTRGAAGLLDWSRRSASDVFAKYFDDWHLTMPAISTGPTVWGVSPDVPGTGLAALAYATRHLVKTGRPVGGSGALTDAIESSFLAAGGETLCSSRVDRLLLRDGSVSGLRLVDGQEIAVGAVVAACDPSRVLLDWIDEPPAAARRLIDKTRSAPVHDGYESKIDAVLSELPSYLVGDRLLADHDGLEICAPTTVVSPDPAGLAAAHDARSVGAVVDEPTILVNIPSVLDETMRTPEGHHILSLEVLYTPYDHPGGWPDSPEPQRWLELWAERCAPGALDSVVAWRAMTPDRYEAEFSMHRGHTPSYSTSPLSALLGREREFTRYRTPIDGLYFSGAGTYPGAGIFGAAGRNAAAAVTTDLRGRVGRHLHKARTARPRTLPSKLNLSTSRTGENVHPDGQA